MNLFEGQACHQLETAADENHVHLLVKRVISFYSRHPDIMFEIWFLSFYNLLQDKAVL